MALQEIKLPRLDAQTALVTGSGIATITFAQWWNQVAGQLEDGINGVIEAQNAADAAQSSANTAQTTADGAQTTADTAVTDAATAQSRADDAYDLADTKVTKNTTSAPSYSTYSGQAISNPPTQAEVQALDNAAASMSSVVHSIITKLQSADVFS